MGFHTIIVFNDLAPNPFGAFPEGGGDGYVFGGSPSSWNGGVILPPWLGWLGVRLRLSDPSGQALSDISLPSGPPDLSLFPVRDFQIEGLEFDETGTIGGFVIEGQVDVLRVPEPGLATLLLFAAGLMGLGWGRRRRPS